MPARSAIASTVVLSYPCAAKSSNAAAAMRARVSGGTADAASASAGPGDIDDMRRPYSPPRTAPRGSDVVVVTPESPGGRGSERGFGRGSVTPGRPLGRSSARARRVEAAARRVRQARLDAVGAGARGGRGEAT